MPRHRGAHPLESIHDAIRGSDPTLRDCRRCAGRVAVFLRRCLVSRNAQADSSNRPAPADASHAARCNRDTWRYASARFRLRGAHRFSTHHSPTSTGIWRAAERMAISRAPTSIRYSHGRCRDCRYSRRAGPANNGSSMAMRYWWVSSMTLRMPARRNQSPQRSSRKRHGIRLWFPGAVWRAAGCRRRSRSASESAVGHACCRSLADVLRRIRRAMEHRPAHRFVEHFDAV